MSAAPTAPTFDERDPEFVECELVDASLDTDAAAELAAWYLGLLEEEVE